MTYAAIARLIFDALCFGHAFDSASEAKRILTNRFDLVMIHNAYKDKIWPEFVDLMDECFPTFWPTPRTVA